MTLGVPCAVCKARNDNDTATTVSHVTGNGILRTGLSLCVLPGASKRGTCRRFKFMTKLSAPFPCPLGKNTEMGAEMDLGNAQP